MPDPIQKRAGCTFSRIRLLNVSLGVKFLLSIGLVIGLSMGAIFYRTPQKQEEYILQQVEKQSRILFRQILLATPDPSLTENLLLVMV